MKKRFDDIFKQGGVLSKHHDNYESRPSQLGMANLVAEAIQEKKNAIIEGETGVGKSMAYLVPSIYSGEKIVVSTSNKNLQDQLYKKDLPFLQKALDKDFSFTVLKGRSNYFSFMMFETNQEILQKKLSNKQIHIIREWAKEELEDDGTGEINNTPIELPQDVKRLIVGSTEVKPETGSSYADMDFGNRARIKAKESQVLLVNHTLLALNASIILKSDNKANIFPLPKILIIDEAHAFEHYAQLAFKDRINQYSMRHFLGNSLVRNICGNKKTADLEADFLKKLHLNYKPPKVNNYYQDTPYKIFKFGGFVDKLRGCVNELTSAKAKADEKGEVRISSLIAEGKHLIQRLRHLSQENKAEVRWAEATEYRKNVTVSICSAPLDISNLMEGAIFDRVKTSIVTSATLAVNGKLDYVKTSLGLKEDVLEMLAKSPFDFKKNTLLFIPKEFTNEFDTAKELVEASGGGVLFLFTSYRALNEHYRAMDVKYPKFKQEYGVSRNKLLNDFKKSGNGVLFATKSFWEGVDIQGESLKMVLIHKLPFPNPSDLLYKTRIQRIDEIHGRKGSHWMSFTLPKMCIDLKQGVGRLIRSKTDYGVIAILDTRLNTARYQKQVLNSLPETYTTQKTEKVKDFFQKRK